MVKYKEIPEKYDVNTKFDTWILAFCPDLDEWFATNKRFFFYEYPIEFASEEDAIDYFKQNPNIFFNLEKDMGVYRPSFNENGVWLENISELVEIME